MKPTFTFLCLALAFCLAPAGLMAQDSNDNKGPKQETTYKTNPDGSVSVETTTYLENGGLINVRTDVPANKVQKWLKENAKDDKEPTKMTSAKVPFFLADLLEELSLELPFTEVRELGKKGREP